MRKKACTKYLNALVETRCHLRGTSVVDAWTAATAKESATATTSTVTENAERWAVDDAWTCADAEEEEIGKGKKKMRKREKEKKLINKLKYIY